MALDIRSFFVGIATVLGILSVGFGGGVLMGGVMSGASKAPNKIERQAAKDTAPKETKEIKPAVEPVAVTPPVQTGPAPQNPPTQAVQAAPQPAPQPAPTMTAQTPPQPALGAQRQVSLPQPSAEPQGLSRREEARLRAQQRREERAQRRDDRRKLLAERRQQEQQRREELKASERSKPEATDDDDDNDDAPPAFMQRRGLFNAPLFRLFGN